MKLRTRRRLIVSVIVLALFGAIAYGLKGQIRSALESLAGNDFAGPGSGSVTLVIQQGETGSTVISELVSLGVVKSERYTTRLASDEGVVFYPGTYSLKSGMRSIDALKVLSSPNNALAHHVTIKEGLRLSSVFAVLSKKTGLPESDFAAAAKRLSDFRTGKGAPSLEGYLFPATYDFGPELSAKQILQVMNDRMVTELESFSVAEKDWHRVLTLAGLIQAEARQTQDFYKVSRVFLNRIASGMKLQSDATVSYGVNGKTVNTTAADRANPNGYNTYVHAGLPIGPISAPGHVAIDAALHPAAGSWIYFCAVNLETGETWFSTTYAEHARAVAAWRAWMKEHPGYE
ncbi:MAG: endolytic transglycosylase MltG [Actinomycetales bacterium]|nr:endolytic transglycosylase MltG [Actinomycetales bacterium]